MPKQSKKLQAGTPADVDVAKIHVTPHNPRGDQDAGDLARLADSLEREGLLQRPVVRPRGDGTLELLAGSRRYRAALKKGYKTLPVTIVDADDRQAIIITMQENFQRQDLTPLEEAQALNLLVDHGGLKSADVAKMLGKSRGYVDMMRQVLKLPAAWQERLHRGEIKKTHALLLAPYVDHPQVLAAVEAGLRTDPDQWLNVNVFREKVKQVAEAVAGIVAVGHVGKRVSRQQVEAAQDKQADDRPAVAKHFKVSKEAVYGWAKAGAPIAANGTTDLGAVADWLYARQSAAAESKPAASTVTATPPGAQPTRRAAPVKGFDTKEVRDRPKLLTERQAFDLLQPYADSRGDLQLIITHARSLLATLKD